MDLIDLENYLIRAATFMDRYPDCKHDRELLAAIVLKKEHPCDGCNIWHRCPHKKEVIK
jgi:hypothetical protein